MAEQNRQLVQQVIEEIWNGGNLDLADRFFAPDYVNHGGLIPDLVRGPEAIKVSVALYRAAFPQLRLTVLDLLTDGQTVAVRWSVRGRHLPAQTRDQSDDGPGAFLGMTFGRVSEDKVAESWTCWETGVRPDPALVLQLRALVRNA